MFLKFALLRFRKAILQNEDVNSESPLSNVFLNDFWGVPLSHRGSHKSYRPITTLTYRFNHLLTGLSAPHFHFTNVVLFGICTYLFTLLAQRVTRSKEVGISAGLLFAVHPIHTEAVAGLVGRAEILSGIFYLLSILCYINETPILPQHCGQGIPWTTMIFTTLSVLSKEIGITSLGICFLFEILKQKTSIKRLASLISCGFCLLLLRGWIMDFQPPSFSEADNPAASPSVSLSSKILTLSFDWSMSSVPLLKNVFEFRSILSLAFYTLILGYTFKFIRRRTQKDGFAYLISLGLIILPFTPASNLLFYVGFVIAERILFIPSMGFCLFMALCIQEAPKRISPSLKAWNNIILGFIVVLGQQGRSIEMRIGETKKVFIAVLCYKNAIKYRPQLAQAYLNLGIIYSDLGQKENALEIWATAMKINDEDLKDPVANIVAKVSAYQNSGKVHLEEALPRQSLYNLLGEVYRALNQSDIAETMFLEAIRIKPDHVPAHLTYGKLLAKN
ncbi:Transmembrane and TPR repeatcontaining protein 2like, partial [Caligus rogercresseyi]